MVKNDGYTESSGPFLDVHKKIFRLGGNDWYIDPDHGLRALEEGMAQ